MTTVNLFAYYKNTVDNMEMMDKAADHAVAEFDAKPIGRGTFLPTGERDIQWHMSRHNAEAAAVKLEAQGFRTKIEELTN